MLWKIFFLVAASTSSVSCMNTTDNYTHYAILVSSDFKLYWKFTETHITFEVHGHTTGWVGIGFSEKGTMVEADIVVGWVKGGQVYGTDRHGVDRNAFPPKDPVQNLEVIHGAECDGWTILKFTRQLAACEAVYDRAITQGTMRLMYAWGAEDPTGNDITEADYHGTANRGNQSMYFLEPADSPSGELPAGPEYKSFEIRPNNFPIPEWQVYHNCRIFQLPNITGKHHIVKVESIIQKGNELHVRHLALYSCGKVLEDPSMLDQDQYCLHIITDQFIRPCQTLIVAWSKGARAFTYPENVGLSIGGPDDPTFVLLESFYYRPIGMDEDIFDSSGFRFIYTSALREHDAGVMQIGMKTDKNAQVLPRKIKSFLLAGYCAAECLTQGMQASNSSNITVFAYLFRTRSFGSGMKLRHIRNGTELPYIGFDNTYDSNYQQPRYLESPVAIEPGDTLRLDCTYDTEEVLYTKFGDNDLDGVRCIAYMHYYPKIDVSECDSRADITETYGLFGIEEWNSPREGQIGMTTILKPANLKENAVVTVIYTFNWTETFADNFSRILLSSKTDGICLRNNNATVVADSLPMPTTEFKPTTRSCVSPRLMTLPQSHEVFKCLEITTDVGSTDVDESNDTDSFDTDLYNIFLLGEDEEEWLEFDVGKKQTPAENETADLDLLSQDNAINEDDADHEPDCGRAATDTWILLINIFSTLTVFFCAH